MKICPQCGYERGSREDGYIPPTQCPRCGTSYTEGLDQATGSSWEVSQGEPSPQEGFPQQVEYVGFWARVVASVIDSVLYFIAAAFLAIIMTMAHPLLPSPQDPLGNLFLSLIFPVAATLFFWFKFLATPGKMVLSAIIVDARTGGVPTKAQFAGRYLAYTLSGLALGLGFLWVAFDRRKQGWHDKLAGTVVVRKQGSLFPTDQ